MPSARRALDRWTNLDDAYPRQLFHGVGSVAVGSGEEGSVYVKSRQACEVHDIPYEELSGAELNERFPGHDLPTE